MYTFRLPVEMINDLYRLREYCDKGSILGQVRKAVEEHLREQERQIGFPLSEVERLIEHGNDN